MAENILPSAAQTAGSTADQPGRPYYESLRETLRQNLEKKRKLDEQLATLEDQMFRMEGNYLEETAMSGNIVRGFDGWVKGVVVGGRSAADDRRRGRIREEDRVFSRSSVNWMRVGIRTRFVNSLGTRD
jgi:chromatin modification-related protein EAF6